MARDRIARRAARHPAWLYNLASHPEATIEFGDGSRVPVRAETLDAEDLETAWGRIAVEAPRVRPIPLEDRSGAPGHPTQETLNLAR